jgi:hypothetical protein
MRYTCLLVHVVSDDLAGGIQKDGKLFVCCSFGVVDPVQSIQGTGLVLENSDQIKGSMTTTSALGRWSLLLSGTCMKTSHLLSTMP